MGKIEVLHPGLYSSLQDLGRHNFLKYGVPQSGVMDSYAAKKANLILSNSEAAPVLEITQLGPKLKFSEPTQLSICGAYLNPKINESVVWNNRILSLEKGDVLSFGKRDIGCRAYIAINGGFISKKVLGSYSWYNGITKFEMLKKGSTIKYSSLMRSLNSLNASVKVMDEYLNENVIQVFPGPEYELLSSFQQKVLMESAFHIDINNNRMAIQIKEPLDNDLDPIITGPVLPGTVQLTPSGKLIVLMRDCQTTGGYPRVLQLSENGINTIAQKVIGDQILFELIEIK
ncbi:biotin-dependent carboxyltransferase family protein [Gillisia sp. JM1]|uniref:5-oxoprolinase subunit C family protein n=1 Tax=Gillisia sp. JM1 TaxID=1283286 RepID=UPI00041D852F|nr:biotin-dependent carboxyltransferase family protein [Gillisia sp. JM1]